MSIGPFVACPLIVSPFSILPCSLHSQYFWHTGFSLVPLMFFIISRHMVFVPATLLSEQPFPYITLNSYSYVLSTTLHTQVDSHNDSATVKEWVIQNIRSLNVLSSCYVPQNATKIFYNFFVYHNHHAEKNLKLFMWLCELLSSYSFLIETKMYNA